MSETGGTPASWEGSCHCGAVQVTLANAPVEVTRCNCSLCSKTGFRGVYAVGDTVTITGELSGYVRSDMDEAMLTNWRCRDCGIATHWTPLTPPPHNRIGINARLFDQALTAALPVNQVDGASW